MKRASLLTVVVATLVTCQRHEPVKLSLKPVRVRAAEGLAIPLRTRFTANIEPGLRVDLAFKRGGYIGEIMQVIGEDGRLRPIQEGDFVRKGQVLCKIREEDYLVKLAQAKAALAQAEAAFAQARQEFERAQSLHTEKVIPDNLFEGAKNKYEGTKSALELYRAMVKEAELALQDTALRAPIDGTVMKRLVEVGSLVGPGVGGFVLADLRSLKAVFGVPDVVIDKFGKGTKVTVNISAYGLKVEGRVTRVSPYADPRSRLFDVEVTIESLDGRLKPGMIASIETPDLENPIVPVVPLEAIRRPPGSTEGFAVVIVESDGDQHVVRVRRVELGDISNGMVEVISGLKVNELVVVSGAAFLSDGEKVVIQNDL